MKLKTLFLKCVNKYLKNKYFFYRQINKKCLKKRQFSHTMDIVCMGSAEKQTASCNIISHISNSKADYIGFVPKGAVLDKNAVYRILSVLEEKDWDFVYTDNDFVEKKGSFKSYKHFFKPDYSPHTLENLWYTQGFEAVKRDKWQNRDYNHKNILSYCEEGSVYHLSEICAHFNGKISEIKPDFQRKTADVSIIIPSKDNPQMLEKCINSIKSSLKFEIIVVDNGSNAQNKSLYEKLLKDHTYIYDVYDFNFSKMCNIGAEKANNPVLVFMNDDIQAMDDIWLEELVAYALRENVGAVGCKLLYPEDNVIQHCGVANFQVGPVHILQYQKDNCDWYLGRNRLVYNTVAVTAACMAVEKSKFVRAGGFDTELSVAYNDVALCFKLLEMGYYNVTNPKACLYHWESVSRGDDLKNKDKFQRLMREQKLLYEKFPKFKNGNDPFYNVHLTNSKTNFDMRF